LTLKTLEEEGNKMHRGYNKLRGAAFEGKKRPFHFAASAWFTSVCDAIWFRISEIGVYNVEKTGNQARGKSGDAVVVS
jgi:hypothetical protein